MADNILDIEVTDEEAFDALGTNLVQVIYKQMMRLNQQ